MVELLIHLSTSQSRIVEKYSPTCRPVADGKAGVSSLRNTTFALLRARELPGQCRNTSIHHHLSGNASQFNIGGTTPYSDVLWSNPVIGQYSTQNLPDTGHTLLPTLHNFTYDADFYVTNTSVTQVLEFDISMYLNGVGMIWGTQCNNLGGEVWDIWDNVNAKWVSTSVACNLINNGLEPRHHSSPAAIR